MVTAVAFRLTMVVGLVAVVLATSVTWLVVTEPLTVADALSDGDVGRLFELVVRGLVRAAESVVRYL